MKKYVVCAAALSQMSLYAGGDIALPLEEPMAVESESVEEHHKESDFYVIVKGLYIAGDSVEHGEATLDGDAGYGFGLDIGYRLGHGFAIEYDFSYAQNSINEIVDGMTGDAGDATYMTSALDIVYSFELTEKMGLFAKIGYEYEVEEIEELDIDKDDQGFIYGVGIEAALNHDYKIVAEYEHSSIEGPRGDSFFAGVMYNF